MPPAIFIVVYYVFVLGCPRWMLYELCKNLYIASAIYLTVSLAAAEGAIMASIWSVASAWNLFELATNKVMFLFAQKYVAVRYSNNFIIDCLVQPFVEGMIALVQSSVEATIDYIRRQYIELIHSNNRSHYHHPFGVFNFIRLGIRTSPRSLQSTRRQGQSKRPTKGMWAGRTFRWRRMTA